MSSLPRVAPTRRTVLRTAAWSAPAVSIAVAAPAYAAASDPVTPVPEASSLKITKDTGSSVKLSTNLPLGAGSHAVTAVVTMSFSGQNKEFRMTGSSIGSPWIKSTASPMSFSTAQLGATGLFEPTFDFTNSSFKSVQVTVTFSFTWNGVTQTRSASNTYNA